MLQAVFTKNVNKIEVFGLTQWDRGRELEVTIPDLPESFEAHFSYKGAGTAYVVDATGKDGTAVISIPNIILTQSKDAVCWIYYTDGDSGETVKTIYLPIEAREKPSDYVYTESEVLSYKSLEERIKALEKGGASDDVIAQAVSAWLEENPIQSGATEAQAKQIQENATNIGKLQATVNDLKENGTGTVASSIEPATDDIPKVFLTGDAFGDMTADKNEVLMDMEYISKTERFKSAIKIKWQGSSSVSTPSFLRKNFTVKLYVDETYESKLKKAFKDWGVEENKWVLKSNWIDITASRNIVSARLWNQIVSTRSDYETLPEEIRTSPRNCEVDGFPIKLYVNGVYEGIYTWNIPKDGFMFNMDEDNLNHAVLCAEKNNDVGTLTSDGILACEFRKTAKIDGTDWSLEFPDELQNGIKNSFNNLITFVMTASDEDFKANLDDYLDVQSAIDYYIYAYLNCGHDSLGKNLIMMTYDGTKWYASQYDMDSTWGLQCAGNKFLEPTMKCPEEYQENNSLLWQRIENCFAEELQTRYFELRKTVLSETNIINEFERFIDVIPSDLYTEEKSLEAYADRPLKLTNNIQQIRKFVVNRAKFVDEEFRNIVPILPTSIALDSESLVVALDGTATLKATIEPSDATATSIIWTSSDNSVATVENGVVTGLKEGTCTITATTTNGLSDSCSISVEEVEIQITGLSFEKASISLDKEEVTQYQLTPIYTPNNTTQTEVEWSSDNESVAKVDSNGLVTIIGGGTAHITATSKSNNSISCTCEFVIKASSMIEYYLTNNENYTNGGNSVTTHSAYEVSDFANGIVDFPTKNTQLATIECNELEVVTEASKRTQQKECIVGFNNGSTNILSLKLSVEKVPLTNATALREYLTENPLKCKFKVCEGVNILELPTSGWSKVTIHEGQNRYKYTMQIDETIASAIANATNKVTSIGLFSASVANNAVHHTIVIANNMIELGLPKSTSLTHTDTLADEYLSEFGDKIYIYYV